MPEKKQEKKAAKKEGKKAERPEKKTAKKKEPAKEVKMSTDDIMEALSSMTVLELSQLVKALEEKFGVTAAAPMMAVAAAPAEASAVAGGPEAEEQTEFDVILKDFGPQKIQVIKAVRELTALGLRESKDMVEGVPSTVKTAVSKDEAAEAKAKLEEAGAAVEIR